MIKKKIIFKPNTSRIMYKIDWRPFVFFLQKNQISLDVNLKKLSMLPDHLEYTNSLGTELATLPDLVARFLTDNCYQGFNDMPFIDPLNENSPPVDFDYLLQNKPDGTTDSIVNMIREIAENTQIFQLMNKEY